MVTGTPIPQCGDGILTSSFVLTKVGSGSDKGTRASSTTGGATTHTLMVTVPFYFGGLFEYVSQAEGDYGDGSNECFQRSDIQGAEGVDCEQTGATLASLKIRKGYWRSSNKSLVVHSCGHKEACVGAMQISSSDDYCADGYKGPCESAYIECQSVHIWTLLVVLS